MKESVSLRNMPNSGATIVEYCLVAAVLLALLAFVGVALFNAAQERSNESIETVSGFKGQAPCIPELDDSECY